MIDRLLLILGGTASTLAFGSPVHAQVAPTSADTQAAPLDADIIVTAQRRSETVREAPAAITALGPQTLQNNAIRDFQGIAQIVPNLQSYSPYGEGATPVFTMRGIAANDYAMNNGRPIAIYLDDSVRGLSIFEAVPLFDMERVEVLRGPQGALYGRNATAGAILAITRKPGFETEGYVTASYGNLDRRHIDGAINLPLSNKVAVRLATTYTKDDGYVTNLFPGGRDQSQTDAFAARGSIRYDSGDSLDVVARGYYARSGGEASGVLPKNINPAFIPADVRDGLGFYETSANFQREKDFEGYGFSLNLEAPVGSFADFALTASYDHATFLAPLDDDGLPVSIIDGDFNVRGARQFYVEARLSSSGDDGLDWLIGANYVNDRAGVDNALRFFNDPAFYTPGSGYTVTPTFGGPLNGAPFNQFNAFVQKRNGFALFGRLTYEVAPDFSLTGGIRYSRDTVKAQDYGGCITLAPVPVGSPNFDNFCTVTNTPVFPVILGFADANFSRSSDNISVEAIASYEVNRQLNVYASYKQGYRAGAVASQAFAAASLAYIVDPEKARSFEVGLKGEWFDRRVQVNIAAFHQESKDLQTYKYIAGAQILGNVDGRVYGVEVETMLHPFDALVLNASVTAQKPEYRGSLLGFPTKGEQLIGASKYTAGLSGTLTLFDNESGRLSLFGNAQYKSRQFFDPVNTIEFSQKGYWLVDGRLSYAPSEKLTVSLFGKNLTKTEYTPYGFAARNDFGYDIFQRGEPRTYGVDASFRF